MAQLEPRPAATSVTAEERHEGTATKAKISRIHRRFMGRSTHGRASTLRRKKERRERARAVVQCPGVSSPWSHRLSKLEDAVELVLRGDASAFQPIVDATSTRLVRVSARILGSVADAEDVVQEAYVKAYRSMLAGQFDRRASLETWLYRIVINASIDARRARARHPSRQAPPREEWHDAGQDGAAIAEARVALAELEAWLSDLPEDQRAVLVLKSIEGLSSAEIADILGCTEGAVEQRLVRARSRLRQRGGHDDGGP